MTIFLFGMLNILLDINSMLILLKCELYNFDV